MRNSKVIHDKTESFLKQVDNVNDTFSLKSSKVSDEQISKACSAYLKHYNNMVKNFPNVKDMPELKKSDITTLSETVMKNVDKVHSSYPLVVEGIDLTKSRLKELKDVNHNRKNFQRLKTLIGDNNVSISELLGNADKTIMNTSALSVYLHSQAYNSIL